MHLTRRHALATTGLLAVAACRPTHKRVAPPAADPDLAVLQAAVAREQVLLASYDAAITASPKLAPHLSVLRADHVTHLASLTQLQPPTSTTATPAVPATGSLPSLEQAASSAHAAAALTASRHLAPLLASLAACEASHVGLL